MYLGCVWRIGRIEVCRRAGRFGRGELLFGGLVQGVFMARADGNLALEKFYRVLMDRRFDFMPRGEHHLRRVYKTVTERHSDLCDDSYLCSASCKDGTNSPEWQHVVRAVLKNIQSRGGPVSKGNAHGFWLFVEFDGPTLTEEEVLEGRRLLKLHYIRERKPRIASRKKKSVLKATGCLSCEACGFDFAAVYGKLGQGFAECHHRLPLADYEVEAPTLLEDLAIVCANCHRILHRSRPMTSVEDLRSLILQRRSTRRASSSNEGQT
jgi:hypothetical protein